MPTTVRHNRQPQEEVKVLMYSIGQEQRSRGEGPRYVTPSPKCFWQESQVWLVVVASASEMESFTLHRAYKGSCVATSSTKMDPGSNGGNPGGTVLM